ncbi:MAG: endonuclease [Tenacibaculum sp.]|nr:endonuclease [Tenacibaculum sp.]
MKLLLKFSLSVLLLAMIGCSNDDSHKEKPIPPKPDTDAVFNIPSQLKEYYKDLKSIEATKLKEELKTIVSKYDNKGYGKRHDYLYVADADLKDPKKVVLLYNGKKVDKREYMSGKNTYKPQTFNTEHVYPQSLFKKQKKYEAKGDLHHLRACDAKINNQRASKPFTDGSGEYKGLGEKWFPGDEWKGDIARMIMYLNVMHDLTFDVVGTKELFLKWNIEDPVSDFEVQRNNEIEKAQKNRNPFIDNPYLATIIYGGDKAENKWK